MRKLAEKALGHLAADADIDRRWPRRIEIGSQNLIPQHQILTVIGVAFRQFLGMVPAMQPWRAENPVERPGAHVDIAMGQKPGKRGHGADPQEHWQRRAEQIERYLAECDLEQRIDHMEAARVDHPQTLDTVMQGVKPPECQFFMRQPVRDIQPEFGDDQAEDDLDRQGPLARPDMCRRAEHRLSDDGHKHGKRCANGRGDLHGALCQQRMGDVIEGFAVAFQPGFLVRHDPFEDGNECHHRKIHHIEPQKRRLRLKRRIGSGETDAIEQGPQ